MGKVILNQQNLRIEFHRDRTILSRNAPHYLKMAHNLHLKSSEPGLLKLILPKVPEKPQNMQFA